MATRRSERVLKRGMNRVEVVRAHQAAADAGLVADDGNGVVGGVEPGDGVGGVGDHHQFGGRFDEIGAVLVENAVAVEQHQHWVRVGGAVRAEPSCAR